MLCLGGFELCPRWVPRTFFMMKAKQATLATKPEFLVAKEKMLVALATVSVAISSPELCIENSKTPSKN